MQNAPWLQYQGSPQPVTVPLGPADPSKAAQEARAAAAAHRAEVEWNASHNPDGTPRVVAPTLLGDPTKTGAAYLASLPQNIRATVQQLIEGRRLLTAREKGQPIGQQLMDAANQADPTFDENVSHARYVERTQYTGQGKGTQIVQAAERLAQHVNDLYAANKALPGPDLGFSPLSNLATGTSNKFHQKQVAAYNTILPLIAGELQKLTKNGSATVDESNKIEHNLQANQPQDVRDAAIKEIVRLGRAQYDPLRESWASAWQGSTPPPMPMDFSKATTAIFDNIENGGDPLPMKRDRNGALIIPGAVNGDNGTGGGDPTDPMTPATGDTRTEITRGPVEKKLSALLASGAPSANIRAFAKANGYPSGKIESTLAWRAMNPTYKGGYDVHQETIIPTTAYQRAAASPLAAGTLAAVDAGTMGLTDEATGAVNALRSGQPLSTAIRSADASKQMLMGANPKAALAGSVVGGAGAMLGGGGLISAGLKRSAPKLAEWLAKNPVKAAALGDTIYGTGFGAGENNDNRALGATVGGVTALPASIIGQAGTKAVGGVVRGVVNPAVDRLRAAGIPLTAGEVLGGGWKKAQDALTSLFGPGDMVARRYQEGRRALNVGAFNQAGDIVGTPINQAGQAGVDALNTAKSNAYSQALDPVSLDVTTPQFVADKATALAAANAVPPAELPKGFAADTLNHYIDGLAPNGTMSGRDFQTSYRGLAQTSAKAAPKIEGHDVAQAIGKGKDALAGALEAQNPGAYEQFLKANSANRHLQVLANAVEAAKNQVSDTGEQLFTPAQLGTAASANGTRFGSKVASASGERPFNQLALDAQQVMSSKLPDSGTAKRIAALALASGGGGSLGYEADGAQGATGLGLALPALLALGGTKIGQQAITAALLKRVGVFRRGGSAMINSPQAGGDILTAAFTPLLAGPPR